MSLKRELKKKFGVDVNDVVKNFNEKKDEFIKRGNFEWDVSALPNWESNTLPSVITDLIGNSEFLNLLTLEEGVKGTREIALLNGDITLQAKVGCNQTPDGALVFTKSDLTTALLYAGIEFCNEDLNKKMTEVLNILGVKKQNRELPAEVEDIIMAYLMKLLQKKAQRLVVLGDTTSLDAELALMDGLVKKLETNADVVEYNSLETAITPTNAYNIAYGMFLTVNPEVFDNGMNVDLWTGRTEALAILKSWNDSNPYSQVAIPAQGTSMSFQLPLTNITVRTLPELNGKNKMYIIPLQLTFLGVDDDADMEMEIKYDEYNDKLKAEASFRLGTQIVWGQYFVRLELTAS